MIRMIQIAAAVALTLTLAACGGDDDSALRDQIAMLEMERDEATTARMTAEGQVTDLQAEVAQLESEIAMLMGRADISAEDLAALRSEAETLRGQLAGRADISAADLVALRSQMEALRADVARLTDERTAAEMERQARLDAQADAGLWDGLARTIAAPIYAASDTDTLANLLPGGQAVFAPLSASVRRNLRVQFPSNGAAYLKTISSDGQGGFNVTWMIDGVETPIHFAADELDEFGGFEKSEDGYYSLYGWTDAFYAEDPDNVDRTDGSSQFDYLDLVGWNLWPFPDGIALSGFSTFGARTMPDNLPTGSATYEGYMYAQRWEADNPDYGRGGGRSLYGDLILEADLSDMVLSGQIDGIYIPDWASASGENEPLEGSSIAIQSTGIDDAEFMAPWVGSGPMDATRDKTLHGFEGTMVGEFYGPAAEEVGGVLSGMRYDMEGDSHELLVGGFGAATNPVIGPE